MIFNIAKRINDEKNVILNMTIMAIFIYTTGLLISVSSVAIINALIVVDNIFILICTYIVLTATISFALRIIFGVLLKVNNNYENKGERYIFDIPSPEFTQVVILFAMALILPMFLLFFKFAVYGIGNMIDGQSYCWGISNLILFKNIISVIPSKLEQNDKE